LGGIDTCSASAILFMVCHILTQTLIIFMANRAACCDKGKRRIER